MLLCISGSLLTLAAAQADLSGDLTYTDQTFTSTINVTFVGQNGADGNGQNYIPQPGEAGAPITLQFYQTEGPGNTVTTSGGGIFASSTGGQGGAAYTDGGPGAGGGIGGVIEISNSGNFVVNTSGNQAHGIQAISQGGVGSAAYDRSSGGGDPGGTGGSGKDVTVNLNDGAAISTTGQESNGILAQSLGNVAGDGNVTSLLMGGEDPFPHGAVGGYGGDVTLTLNEGASVSTSGANSNGIVAMSRGSSGGQGASVEGGLGGGTAGNGGSGGNSGVITITSNGSITTTGNASMGIVAQSSAGNGGYGGDATGSGKVVAGQAGAPGNTGDITVTNNGSITTSGAYSPGILAQSFAGGGGVGGSASGSLFYDQGGGASASTNGGTVNIALAGDITTHGDNSQAVIAQSIGGKGGMGGDAGGMIYTKGGDGSLGGSGGSATVTALVNSGLHINTQYGQSSHGIVAQSVGGGGGMGGAANADGVNMASAIGGQAGAGGNGGTADVNVMNSSTDPTPSILTGGPGAFGILAQSVGGGGGAGGGAYTVSAGMLADVSFAVGGAGGDGGNGGSANATLNWFNLQTGFPSAQNPTLAADSIGVAVQSIGGGGGQGGSGAASAYAIALPLADEDPAANVTFSGAFAVGGNGGKGGSGGSATASILFGSTVSTYGDGSLGVKVQSIGGGGGHGGDSSALAASIGYGIKNRYIK